MTAEIKAKLDELHSEYTSLQKMQWKLPSRPNRTANHEDIEQQISSAAYALSRRIADFKAFCRIHPTYEELANLLSQHGEVENILFGANAIAHNPYKRF